MQIMESLIGRGVLRSIKATLRLPTRDSIKIGKLRNLSDASHLTLEQNALFLNRV